MVVRMCDSFRQNNQKTKYDSPNVCPIQTGLSRNNQSSSESSLHPDNPIKISPIMVRINATFRQKSLDIPNQCPNVSPIQTRPLQHHQLLSEAYALFRQDLYDITHHCLNVCSIPGKTNEFLVRLSGSFI